MIPKCLFGFAQGVRRGTKKPAPLSGGRVCLLLIGSGGGGFGDRGGVGGSGFGSGGFGGVIRLVTVRRGVEGSGGLDFGGGGAGLLALGLGLERLDHRHLFLALGGRFRLFRLRGLGGLLGLFPPLDGGFVLLRLRLALGGHGEAVIALAVEGLEHGFPPAEDHLAVGLLPFPLAGAFRHVLEVDGDGLDVVDVAFGGGIAPAVTPLGFLAGAENDGEGRPDGSFAQRVAVLVGQGLGVFQHGGDEEGLALVALHPVEQLGIVAPLVGIGMGVGGGGGGLGFPALGLGGGTGGGEGQGGVGVEGLHAAFSPFIRVGDDVLRLLQYIIPSRCLSNFFGTFFIMGSVLICQSVVNQALVTPD